MVLYWLLPGIICLGILTTYTDLKESRIRNKHIVAALVYALIAYSIFVFLNLGTIRIGYFIELLIMCALSLTTGFILWYVGLWTAGDAKLFLAYSTLIPLSVYNYGHMPYFDSTNILINTFIPIFLFLFISLLFKTSLKQKLFFLKKSFVPKQVIMLIVFLFAFGWIIKLMFLLTRIPVDYFLTMFILFILVTFFERVTSLSMFKIILLIGALRFFFDSSVFTLSFWINFLSIVLAFVILRFFVLCMGFYYFTKEVDIKLLEPGMLPAESVYKEGREYKKQELILYSLFSYLEEKSKKRDYVIEPMSEGLTEKNIKELKKLEKRSGFEHLRVQQTIQFAPYMFLGAILTILFKGNMVISIIAQLS